MATNAQGGYLSFVDGFHEKGDDPETSTENVIFHLRVGQGYKACRGCDFVEQIVKHVPQERVRYQKYLESMRVDDDRGKAILAFRDGSAAEANVNE